MYDVVVIGGGVIGTSIARDLSKYDLKIALIEKETDVANGTTKANSAIIHAGYDALPGTLKAKLNVEGNAMFDKVCDELDVPFKRIGSIVVAFSQDEMEKLHELYQRGIENGVSGLEIIDKDRLLEIEPHISDKAIGALLAKTAGITSPYELCIAQVENAVENGVELVLDTEVKGIEKCDDEFLINTNKGEFRAGYIVNSAGLFADEINTMLGGEEFHIIPRKGEYCLFDRSQGHLANHIIFQVPTRFGKGILITPTVHGNLLIGPNSVEVEDKNDLATTDTGLESVIKGAGKSIDGFSMREVITSFSGLRASTKHEDFIINVPVHGAVNAAGIDSPGLSSAPAISKMIVSMLKDMGLKLNEKKFNPIRKSRKRFAEMTNMERAEAIRENPLYGRIICRCETVTEGEIIDAIRRPAGARTVDGVKRRLRAGMGRCQGGFCMPRVVEILSRELGVPYMDVLKDSKEGYIFTGMLKDSFKLEDGEGDA